MDTVGRAVPNEEHILRALYNVAGGGAANRDSLLAHFAGREDAPTLTVEQTDRVLIRLVGLGEISINGEPPAATYRITDAGRSRLGPQMETEAEWVPTEVGVR